MRTIRNRTTRPLRVPLHQGKTLHLGPLQEGQIATQDVDHPGVLRLVEAQEIEILGGAQGTPQEQQGPSVHEDPVGHHPDLTVKHRGDR